MSDIGKTALKNKIDAKIYDNESQLITGAILNEVLQDAVDTLADGGNLDAGSVDTSNLKNNAVTTAKITDSNVTTAKIADGNITTGKIADSNVTTAKLADGAVTTAKITDGNVTKAKIASAVTDDIDYAVAAQGLYQCTTEGSTAAKEVTATGYELRGGGSIKIKFTNKNTASSPTLSINGSLPKQMMLGSSSVDATNTWEDGDIVEFVYYPLGNVFYGKLITLDKVSVSQNTETGHAEIHIGNNDYPIASVEDVNRVGLEYPFDGSASFTSNFFAKTGQKIIVEVKTLSSGGQFSIFTIDHSDRNYAVVNSVGIYTITAEYDGYLRFYMNSSGSIGGEIHIKTTLDLVEETANQTKNKVEGIIPSVEPISTQSNPSNDNAIIVTDDEGKEIVRIDEDAADVLALRQQGSAIPLDKIREITDEDEDEEITIVDDKDNLVIKVNKNGLYSRAFYDMDGNAFADAIETAATMNIFAGIPSVGVIGDSLSIGASADGTIVEDNAQYAWWRVLERKSGMTYRRYAKGGLSTRTWLTDTDYGYPTAQSNPCHAYIIALEVNDRAILNEDSSYLGSVSDIDMSNPDNNADTYYGNLAKIIQKMKIVSPNARFLIFNNPRSGEDTLYAQLNQAIEDVIALFSYCYLVDMVSMFGSKYTSADSFIVKMMDATAHYPSCAYMYMGELCSYAIGKTIKDNYQGFKTIQFALN